MKPRVFVSSVVKGFEHFRQAAREGIEAAGGEAVLVNEDSPALAESSRNACLDAVDSSDIYIAILGERGGWTTPSGKLVVEEEYERAQAKRIPRFVFVQRTARDTEATRLINKVSDYTTGTFRAEFSTPEELRSEIERALGAPIQNLRNPAVDPELVTRRLNNPERMSNDAALHFVLLPERDEEVVDVVRLGTPEFVRGLFEVAHAADVGLFSYEAEKSKELRRTSFQVRQQGDRRRDDATGNVVLEVGENGLVAIDSTLDGPSISRRMTGFASMLIVRRDVELLLRSMFAFASRWYDTHDPYRRHQRFHYGVALTGLKYHKWVDEVPAPSNSFTLGMGNRADPLLVLPRPRCIGREDLAQPQQEIERLITLMARDLSST